MSLHSLAFPSNTICYISKPIPSKAESLALQTEQEAKAYKLKIEHARNLGEVKEPAGTSPSRASLDSAPVSPARVNEYGQLIGRYVNVTA